MSFLGILFKKTFNAVEVHPQLSNIGHWWVLVHCGPFPMWLKFFLIGDVWRCVPLSKCVSAFCRNHFPHKLEIKWFPDHELDWFPWFRLATNLQFTNGKAIGDRQFQRITAFGITLPSMLGTCLEAYCKWAVFPKGLRNVSSCFLWEQVSSGGIMYNSV
jgi:hypothetical protein